jgi:predicted site-specific integrase-resolvase
MSQSPSENLPYYPAAEAARMLGVSPYTLKRWRAEGVGPAYTRVSHRVVIYPKAALDEWCARRTYKHRADELARSTDETP